MSRCLNQQALFPEGLTKSGEKRHVLARRPDRPVAQMNQQFRRRIKERVKEVRQRDLAAGIWWQSKCHKVKLRRLQVWIRTDYVPQNLTSGKSSLRAPRC